MFLEVTVKQVTEDKVETDNEKGLEVTYYLTMSRLRKSLNR